MKLLFLGTRGYISRRSRSHRRHSALLITSGPTHVMIDCGEDWTARLGALSPQAILLTHAHPDHAGGLVNGAGCTVFASRACWHALERYPIRDRRIMRPRQPLKFGRLVIEAFPVVHSLRAPAVGYRVTEGGVAFFYAPDVVAIPDRRAALAGLRLYVGDGATLRRPMIRRRNGRRFGHTSVQAELDWCRAEGVPRALFTHCGTEIVEADGRRVAATVRSMARARGMVAQVAHDGQAVSLTSKD